MPTDRRAELIRTIRETVDRVLGRSTKDAVDAVVRRVNATRKG